MNTLHTSPLLPPPTQNARRNDFQKKEQTLALDTSRGYNVSRNPAEEANVKFDTHQAVKRQKLEHPEPVSSISSESVDEVPAENVRYNRAHASRSPANDQQSPLLVASFKTQPRGGPNSAFHSVEYMMNSGKKKKHKKPQSRLRQRSSSLANYTIQNRSN